MANEKNQTATLEDRVIQWFERTGFPLEMRVFKKMVARFYSDFDLRDSNIEVSALPAYFYSDPNSQETREADLMLSFYKQRYHVGYRLTFCFECKRKGKGDFPFIILTTEEKYVNRRLNNKRIFTEVAACLRSNAEVSGMKGIFQFPHEPRAGYSLKRMQVEDKKEDEGFKISAQLLSACYGHKLVMDSLIGAVPCCEIVVPVLLTEDEVFYLSLDLRNKPQLSKQGYGIVDLPIPKTGDVATSVVYVVTESDLDNFLGIIRDSVDSYFNASHELLSTVYTHMTHVQARASLNKQNSGGNV